MSSQFSTNLRTELPGTGEQAGTWGNTTNTSLGSVLEQAIAGVSGGPYISGSYPAVNFPTDADITLTANNGSVDQSRSAVLVVTSSGSLTATRNVIAPASASKVYTVRNSTTGGKGIQIKYATGVGVFIGSGETRSVFGDGSNFFVCNNIIENAGNAGNLGGQPPSYYQSALGFTAVQQGGGAGQLANKLYIGWTGSSTLALQVDSTNFGSTWPISVTGAAAVANALNPSNSYSAANMALSGNVNTSAGLSIGAGIATGFYGDNNNVAIRAYSEGGIYFQNASGAETYAILNNGGLTVNGSYGFVGVGSNLTGNATGLNAGAASAISSNGGLQNMTANNIGSLAFLNANVSANQSFAGPVGTWRALQDSLTMATYTGCSFYYGFFALAVRIA